MTETIFGPNAQPMFLSTMLRTEASQAKPPSPVEAEGFCGKPFICCSLKDDSYHFVTPGREKVLRRTE